MQPGFDDSQFALTEAETLAQFRRPVGTAPLKDGLAPGPHHMNMRGPMIGRGDDDAQAGETQYGRHGSGTQPGSAEMITCA